MFQIVRTELDCNGHVVERQPLQPPYDLWEDAMALAHADRPAIIYVAEGEIIEYASNCAAPIVHKAGEIGSETSEVSHWWKNLGSKTVVLRTFC